MTTGGFSSKRLTRLGQLLERFVESGFVPGALAVCQAIDDRPRGSRT